MIQAIPYVGEPATIALACIDMEKQIRMRNGFDEASLRGLADTIRTMGVIQPIVVRPSHEGGRYVLVAGERRVLASTMAGLTTIPALVRSGATPGELAALQAVENLQRENLALADIAEGLEALSRAPDFKDWKTLAKRLGKHPTWVSRHRSILKLQPTARAALANGLTDDLELLLALDSLDKLKTDKARTLLAKQLTQLEAGLATRATVRAALATAKLNDAQPASDNEADDADGDGEGDDQPAPRKQFAKLELAEDVARTILAALEYAAKHKPSSRPPETTVAHVAAFIAKNWPT